MGGPRLVRPVALLVRSWNVFHGNAHPPDRRSRLREMVRLASADRPDVLCLQELPVWALRELASWAGMEAHGAVARPSLGPARLAGALTRLHNGFFRSAIAGQANAILLRPGLHAHEHAVRKISEGVRERRICHAVRLDGVVVGNLHATNDFRRPRVPAAEIERGRALVEELAAADEVCVLAGDFNLRAADLEHETGWSELGPGIDHVLVRGAEAGALHVWPWERRMQNGRVLSDHAPIELVVG